jgi:hypothetical protein
VIRGWQTDLSKIRAGDALNKSGSHVRLTVEATSSPQVRIIVLESAASRTCKRPDGTVMGCEGVCECARPIAEFNGYTLLRFKQIRD